MPGPIGERGPQGTPGDQGERGEKGDPGAFIHIVDYLSSSSYLPDASAAYLQDPTQAYLVGSDNDVYILIGENAVSAEWMDIGPLNVATYITVNGEYVGQ